MATPKTRTLAKATVILGGKEALAEALSVNVEVLTGWLDGVTDVPDSSFFAALEIVAKGPFNY